MINRKILLIIFVYRKIVYKILIIFVLEKYKENEKNNIIPAKFHQKNL